MGGGDKAAHAVQIEVAAEKDTRDFGRLGTGHTQYSKTVSLSSGSHFWTWLRLKRVGDVDNWTSQIQLSDVLFSLVTGWLYDLSRGVRDELMPGKKITCGVLFWGCKNPELDGDWEKNPLISERYQQNIANGVIEKIKCYTKKHRHNGRDIEGAPSLLGAGFVEIVCVEVSRGCDAAGHARPGLERGFGHLALNRPMAGCRLCPQSIE